MAPVTLWHTITDLAQAARFRVVLTSGQGRLD